MPGTSASLFICQACGTQFPESTEPPQSCAICDDARQYVPPSGQQWTTLEQLRRGHRNAFQQLEPNLLGIGTTPEFAIGQRALLLRTPTGNFLWDCITLLDDATVEIVRGLGGLRGIAISHPHYYSAMLEWSRAFGDAPIFLHAADREWVMRSGAAVEFWNGERKELAPGLTLLNCGGHFAGGTVLHWAGGASGGGALLSGDILQVTPDGLVSFMYSYPNLVPLAAGPVQRIANVLEPFAYDRVYGAFWERVIPRNAKAAVAKSVARYLEAIAPTRAT
jgi:glyoxylase-like metal-dependent hydrolase (beta-lactamase superfamily II)